VAESFYRVKDEVRILGLDDSPFKRSDSSVLVVGCVFRGGKFLDGVVSTRVEVDGDDATDKLISLVKDIRFKDLRVILLDGIAFGGFNVVDINRLYGEGGLPVVVVTRDLPDFDKIRKALKYLPDWRRRWDYMVAAGDPVPVKLRSGRVFVQFAGVCFSDVESIIKLSATRSLLPEPIRCAHLIGQGVVSGTSKGKA